MKAISVFSRLNSYLIILHISSLANAVYILSLFLSLFRCCRLSLFRWLRLEGNCLHKSVGEQTIQALAAVPSYKRCSKMYAWEVAENAEC